MNDYKLDRVFKKIKECKKYDGWITFEYNMNEKTFSIGNEFQCIRDYIGCDVNDFCKILKMIEKENIPFVNCNMYRDKQLVNTVIVS